MLGARWRGRERREREGGGVGEGGEGGGTREEREESRSSRGAREASASIMQPPWAAHNKRGPRQEQTPMIVEQPLWVRHPAPDASGSRPKPAGTGAGSGSNGKVSLAHAAVGGQLPGPGVLASGKDKSASRSVGLLASEGMRWEG